MDQEQGLGIPGAGFDSKNFNWGAVGVELDLDHLALGVVEAEIVG